MTTNATDDELLTTGLLLVGGGVAGYFGGRWLAERSRDSESNASSIAPAPPPPSLGIDRNDPPTMTAIIDEAIRLLDARRTAKGKANR